MWDDPVSGQRSCCQHRKLRALPSQSTLSQATTVASIRRSGRLREVVTYGKINKISPKQEPITRSLHLPYYSFESTLSRIFLFLEAPPTEVFAGVFVITNHERAAVTHCLQVTGKQSDLHLHGLHDSKRKLMFFVHRLIPQRFDRF